MTSADIALQLRPGTALASWRAHLAILLLFFIAVAPTLTWLEFSSGSENLVVATALETRRTGHWPIPTMQGQARIAKPPLAGWVAAGAIRQSTLRQISASDSAIRARGYAALAWDVRWPTLLLAVLTLSGVLALARVTGNRDSAVIAAIVCGTTYAFLRFSREATTDVMLSFFVVWTNVLLAMAILRGRRWFGCIGAGIAIGLALMTKGPVALAETVAPAVAFVIWRRLTSPKSERRASGWIGPVLAGVGVMLLVAAPWYLLVIERMRHETDLVRFWYSEVTGAGASDLAGNRWYSHLSLFWMVLPWLLAALGGMKDSLSRLSGRIGPGEQHEHAQRAHGLVFVLFLVCVPIIIISFSRDRKERFLLPMFAPAAVLAGHSLRVFMRRWNKRRRGDVLVAGVHWVIVALIAVGFPVAAALGFVKDSDGRSWYPFAWPALVAAAAGLAIVTAGIVASLRRPIAFVAATASAALVVQAMFASGYARCEKGRSELLPLAESILGADAAPVVYCYTPGRRAPQDLSIYLNREVHDLSDPAALPPQATIVVTMRGRKEPDHAVPASWKELASAQGEKHVWHAYAVGR